MRAAIVPKVDGTRVASPHGPSLATRAEAIRKRLTASSDYPCASSRRSDAAGEQLGIAILAHYFLAPFGEAVIGHASSVLRCASGCCANRIVALRMKHTTIRVCNTPVVLPAATPTVANDQNSLA